MTQETPERFFRGLFYCTVLASCFWGVVAYGFHRITAGDTGRSMVVEEVTHTKLALAVAPGGNAQLHLER